MNDKFNIAEKFIILRAFCKRSEMGIRNSILYLFVLIIHSLYMLNTLIKFFYFFGRNIFIGFHFFEPSFHFINDFFMLVDSAFCTL